MADLNTKALASAVHAFNKEDIDDFDATYAVSAAIEAYLAALSGSPQVEAGMELASFGYDRTQHYLLCFEDNAIGFMHFDTEAEAHRAYEERSVTWNCTLYEIAKRKGAPLFTRPREQEGGEAPGDDWELENRAFAAANDSSLPKTTRTLIRDIWKAYCDMEKRAHPAPLPADGWVAGAEAMREAAAKKAKFLLEDYDEGDDGFGVVSAILAIRLPTPPASTEGGAS